MVIRGILSRVRRDRGFTVVELMVVILLAGILSVAGLMFLGSTTKVFNSQGVRMLNQDDARTAVNQMTRYLRMATDSMDNQTTQSNAVATALGMDIEFFCDVDGDGEAEKVRYYLVDNELRSQTEEPEWVEDGDDSYWEYGEYETDGIVIENRVRNEEDQPLFTYYHQGESGLEEFTPSTDELRREIVSVGLFIRVGERPELAARDMFLSTEVQIRQRYSGGLDI